MTVRGGVCEQVGGDLWFPAKGASPEPAKALCRRCDQRKPCLAYALATQQTEGVWGATSAGQREALWAILAEDGDNTMSTRVDTSTREAG
jgi:hypothetical protein